MNKYREILLKLWDSAADEKGTSTDTEDITEALKSISELILERKKVCCNNICLQNMICTCGVKEYNQPLIDLAKEMME